MNWTVKPNRSILKFVKAKSWNCYSKGIQPQHTRSAEYNIEFSSRQV